MQIVEKCENHTKMVAKIVKIQKERFKTTSKSLKIMQIVEKRENHTNMVAEIVKIQKERSKTRSECKKHVKIGKI